MKTVLALLGRIMITALFLFAAYNKITEFSVYQERMSGAGMPVTGLLLVGTIAFLIVGGLSLIVGYKTRLGAILLILFLIPETVIFYPIWSDSSQMQNFMRNVTLLGGLFMVLAFGPGGAAVDALACRRKERAAVAEPESKPVPEPEAPVTPPVETESED